MAAVKRRAVGLALLALGCVACASQPERQWYKPGDPNYTQADFRRDEAACTRNRVLDEECLKQRGWVPLSADRPAPPTGPQPGRGGRY
jgi:hypothetical protein